MRVNAVDFIFDGQCGFCTRAVNWVMRLDKKHRIRVHPFQQRGILERFKLSDSEVRAAACAIAPTIRVSGAGAINLVIDVALGTGFFSFVYRLPLIKQTQDGIYAWIASHRYLLKGMTPWCETHPGQCNNASEKATCAVSDSRPAPRCSN